MKATSGLRFLGGSAAVRLRLPAAPARQALFSSRPARAKLQFPGGRARSGLEVGSLEVTRATGAGGVSSERRGARRRSRGARGAGSPDVRYVAPGAGSASRKCGGESVAARTPRVSAGGRPGVGTGRGGRRRRDSRPPDPAGLVPAWLNFPGVHPGAVGKSLEAGSGGFASRLCRSGAAIWGNRAEPQFPLQ
ncbi:uncharacterized protein LOC144337442 [Macaca mulatta]